MQNNAKERFRKLGGTGGDGGSSCDNDGGGIFRVALESNLTAKIFTLAHSHNQFMQILCTTFTTCTKNTFAQLTPHRPSPALSLKTKAKKKYVACVLVRVYLPLKLLSFFLSASQSWLCFKFYCCCLYGNCLAHELCTFHSFCKSLICPFSA